MPDKVKSSQLYASSNAVLQWTFSLIPFIGYYSAYNLIIKELYVLEGTQNQNINSQFC